MSTFQWYLTLANSAYRNIFENSIGQSGEAWFVAGKKPTPGQASYGLIKKPTNMPLNGTVVSAYLRLPEMNYSGYSSDTLLNLRVSRITGEWNQACDWASCPEFDDAVYGELALENDIPTAARYINNPETDYRTGYHATVYKYWGMYSGLMVFAYITAYYPDGFTSNGIFYNYSGVETPAYYSTYIKYRTIDITAVMQDLIDHGGSGFIIWHDLAEAVDTRKYFKSVNNSSAHLQPRIDMEIELLPALTDPVIGTVNTVTDSPHDFSFGASSDANGTVEASAISYEFELSCDDGANWSEAQDTDPGDPSASYDIKTCLGLEDGQYYYGNQFKIRARAKCTYQEVTYYSSEWDDAPVSATFAVDYRVVPTAPTFDVDNYTPYEGESVVFSCGRPESYNTHDSAGSVNVLEYSVEINGSEVADETEPATSASKDVPYVTGALTSGADLAVSAKARVIDAEGQLGAYCTPITMTVKRYRKPVINIANVDRNEESLVVHIVMQDTGFGGVQSGTQIRKAQYCIDGETWIDATLGSWVGLTNSFTISSGITRTGTYTLQVRAVNVEPVEGLGDKTGDPATEYIMQAQPVTRFYSDSSTGKKGTASQAFYAHSEEFDPAEFPENGGAKVEKNLDVGGIINGGVISCKAYNDAAQSIPNETETALELPKEYCDTEDMHDLETNNARITIKTAGRYAFGGQLSFAANSTGIRVIAVRLNGTTNIAKYQGSASSGGRTMLTVSGMHTFAANDYIELTCYQARGGALNTDISDLPTSLWAYKVSD